MIIKFMIIIQEGYIRLTKYQLKNRQMLNLPIFLIFLIKKVIKYYI